MNKKGLQKTPIYRALNRGNLFMGGDRELVMLALLSSFTLIITFDLFAIVCGFCLSIAAIFLLRRMAKSDPHMRSIYMKHIRYKAFYPAKSSPFRIDK